MCHFSRISYIPIDHISKAVLWCSFFITSVIYKINAELFIAFNTLKKNETIAITWHMFIS
jgi:hypothetical protein